MIQSKIHRFMILCAGCLLLALAADNGFAQQKKARKYALLVGVSNYFDKRIEDLNYAENDVIQMGIELEKLGFNVLKVSGKEATQETVLKKLDLFMKACGKLESNEVVLVMFSGHGQQLPISENGKKVEVPFFLPQDAIAYQPSVHALRGKSAAEVEKEFKLVSLNRVLNDLDQKSNSSKNILIVDACRNNPAKGTAGVDGRATKLPLGVSVLFGAKSGQQSWESADEKIKHGVLTHFLLQGLRGAATNQRQEVTWGQLSAFAQEEVPRTGWKIAGGKDRVQNPHVISSTDAVMILGKAKSTRRILDGPRWADLEISGLNGAEIQIPMSHLYDQSLSGRFVSPMKARVKRGSAFVVKITNIPGNETKELRPIVYLPVGGNMTEKIFATTSIKVKLDEKLAKSTKANEWKSSIIFEDDNVSEYGLRKDINPRRQMDFFNNGVSSHNFNFYLDNGTTLAIFLLGEKANYTEHDLAVIERDLEKKIDQALLDRLDRLRRWNESVKFESVFKLALDRLGESPRLFIIRGKYFWIEKREPINAIEWLDRAIAIDKKNHEAHELKGHCLMELERFEEAAKAYRICSILKPHDLDNWHSLSVSLMYSGDGHAALLAINRAIESIEAIPQNLIYFDSWDYYRTRVSVYESVRDYKRAREQLVLVKKMIVDLQARAISRLKREIAEIKKQVERSKIPKGIKEQVTKEVNACAEKFLESFIKLDFSAAQDNLNMLHLFSFELDAEANKAIKDLRNSFKQLSDLDVWQFKLNE